MCFANISMTGYVATRPLLLGHIIMCFLVKKGCSQNLCIFMLDSQFGASMMRSPLSVFKLKKRHIPVKLLMFQPASLLLKPSGFVDDVRI
jgi:hypothetical protein